MDNYIQNRYDFVFLFDVKDGNPNGDPDFDNQPRIDFETRMGIVSDVCIKRKVRNYVQLKVEAEKNDEEKQEKLDPEKYGIFIQQGNILNDLINKASQKVGGDENKGRELMCEKYYDIRTFGAVMSTGDKQSSEGNNDDSSPEDNKQNKKGKKSNKRGIGVVRGPVQFTFSRSVDPIDSRTHSLTRCCVVDKDDSTTFGSKSTVSYGLYRMYGYVSAFDGVKCHFTENDLTLLWEALINAFEHDRSAARGEMNARALIVFKHDSKLGKARSSELFERVRIEKNKDEKGNEIEFPREYSDYIITLNKTKLPDGITVLGEKEMKKLYLMQGVTIIDENAKTT